MGIAASNLPSGGCWPVDDNFFGQADAPIHEAGWVVHPTPIFRFISSKTRQPAVLPSVSRALKTVYHWSVCRIILLKTHSTVPFAVGFESELHTEFRKAGMEPGGATDERFGVVDDVFPIMLPKDRYESPGFIVCSDRARRIRFNPGPTAA